MILSETLLQQDIGRLSEIADVYDCDCNTHSKLEMVQSIYYRLMSRPGYAHLFKSLERPVLHYLTFLTYQSKKKFSKEEIVYKGQLVNTLFKWKTDPIIYVRRLCKRGWLIPIVENKQLIYTIPLDLHRLLMEELTEHWQQQTHRISAFHANVVIRDEQSLLPRDVFAFLDFVQHERPLLKREGVLHQRYLRSLQDQFAVKEPYMKEEQWRFGYGRRFPHYPDRVALIYDYCFEKNWLLEGENRLMLTSLGEQFHKENCLEEPFNLKRYWLRLYAQAIPGLAFYDRWLKSLLTGKWVEYSSVQQMMVPWVTSYYYDDAKDVFNRRIIKMLLHLGSIQIAYQDSNEKKYIRWNESS